MAAIRKSGGVVVFHWDGKIVDPRDQAFADALATRRFRTIENAASEEVSIGWVTPADPTGESFALEDLDGGPGTWLRFRLDKKSMPKKWLQIHRDAAEKSRGKKLSARERREMKDDLMEKLLPRVLPAITLVDALLFFDRRLVLLFATSKSAREAFGKLFFESFGTPLERANPLASGLRLSLDPEQQRAIERAEPVRWPDTQKAAAAPTRKSRMPAAATAAITADITDESEDDV
jgi:DNA recombination-dependent growth factor C